MKKLITLVALTAFTGVYGQQIDRSVTEANNVVEMFTPHRPS